MPCWIREDVRSGAVALADASTSMLEVDDQTEELIGFANPAPNVGFTDLALDAGQRESFAIFNVSIELGHMLVDTFEGNVGRWRMSDLWFLSRARAGAFRRGS